MHVVLDVVVESNLPLYGDAAKIGLGVANNALAAYIVEELILVAGLILFLNGYQCSKLQNRPGLNSALC